MEPSLVFRLLICNLVLRLPLEKLSDGPGEKARRFLDSLSCYAKIRINGQPSKSAPVPFKICSVSDDQIKGSAAAFDLSKTDLRLLSRKPARLTIEVFATSLQDGADLFLGKMALQLDLSWSERAKSFEYHSGWRNLQKKDGSSSFQLHSTVRTDKEQRYIFKFGKEAARNPPVFNVTEGKKQPIFACSFGHSSSQIKQDKQPNGKIGGLKKWMKEKLGMGDRKQKTKNDGKDWSVTVKDLSGSPLAKAVMIDPFAPSLRTDCVTSAKPGSWLILNQRNGGKWDPWARLEAWRNTSEGTVEYRFERLTETPDKVPIFYSSVSATNGGKFTIDIPTDKRRGFIMSSTVKGEGKRCCPAVEVSTKFTKSAKDLAAYVALGATIDLCTDACRPLSHHRS